ncbi:hypothetical protein Dimus_036582 [Dionaea muscipula]
MGLKIYRVHETHTEAELKSYMRGRSYMRDRPHGGNCISTRLGNMWKVEKARTTVDPFEAIMGKEHKGRLRLYGRGVLASTLGKVSARNDGASVYVLKSF